MSGHMNDKTKTVSIYVAENTVGLDVLLAS